MQIYKYLSALKYTTKMSAKNKYKNLVETIKGAFQERRIRYFIYKTF